MFLRKVEHRLQYLDDAQRHDLPAGRRRPSTRSRACRGFSSWHEFSRGPARSIASRSRAISRRCSPNRRPQAEPWPEHPRLAALRASQRYAALPDESRRRLDALIPALGARRARRRRTPRPRSCAASTWSRPSRAARAYLALLAEHPQALERVARIVGASSWAAEFLTRHPVLLDELLDDRVLYAPPDLEAFARQLRVQLERARRRRRAAHGLLREMHQAQVFRLLAQDLAGLLTVERLADHLSALADLVLEVTIELAWHELPRRHRAGAPRFAVIAYGKLGGKELGYACDLDVVFLYDDAARAGAGGLRAPRAALHHWLTTRTSAGELFDTDLALRPNGACGPAGHLARGVRALPGSATPGPGSTRR